MALFAREDILARLRSQVAAGRPIVGGGAGTGISAKLIAEPADAQYILDHTTGIVGFYGASSMERLPVEPAITGRVKEFGQLKFKV